MAHGNSLLLPWPLVQYAVTSNQVYPYPGSSGAVLCNTVTALGREEGYTMKYSLSPKEMPSAKPEGFLRAQAIFCLYFALGISLGLRLCFIIHPASSHNADILNYNSSIKLPGRSILEELILHIAPTAGQYGKMLPSRLSNTGELNFNILMLSY